STICRYRSYQSCLSLLLLTSTSSCIFLSCTAITNRTTLTLHDALPIFGGDEVDEHGDAPVQGTHHVLERGRRGVGAAGGDGFVRSEEHTSELQSRFDLVCRLLLEKKRYRIEHAYSCWHNDS